MSAIHLGMQEFEASLSNLLLRKHVSWLWTMGRGFNCPFAISPSRAVFRVLKGR